jgi:hypothetical protein
VDGVNRVNRVKGIKGLKAHLPNKPCVVCGRPMAWRRAWAKNWDEVKFCSEACRRRRQASGE